MHQEDAYLAVLRRLRWDSGQERFQKPPWAMYTMPALRHLLQADQVVIPLPLRP